MLVHELRANSLPRSAEPTARLLDALDRRWSSERALQLVGEALIRQGLNTSEVWCKMGVMRESIREPLHQRIERLVRGRRVVLILVAFLVFARPATRMIKAATQDDGSPVYFSVAVASLVLAALVVWLMIRESRKAGQSARTMRLNVLSVPTPWKNLDEALADYGIRTGTPAPEVGFIRHDPPSDRVDAELVYLPADDVDSEHFNVLSPMNARDGDLPAIGFDEAMLNSYTSAELLAVTLHLMSRGRLSRGPAANFDNGVCQADSETLLVTHDHVALLNAIQRSNRNGATALPSEGSTHFADEQMRAKDLGRAGLFGRWETADRLAELRTHLAAAALDVAAAEA